MTDIKGILIAVLCVIILRFIFKYTPKWFGFIPVIGFLIFSIILLIHNGINNQLLPGIFWLSLGEIIIFGEWCESIVNKNNKSKIEIEKMKAKDLSNK